MAVRSADTKVSRCLLSDQGRAGPGADGVPLTTAPLAMGRTTHAARVRDRQKATLAGDSSRARFLGDSCETTDLTSAYPRAHTGTQYSISGCQLWPNGPQPQQRWRTSTRHKRLARQLLAALTLARRVGAAVLQ